jgi:hypothetical protein
MAGPALALGPDPARGRCRRRPCGLPHLSLCRRHRGRGRAGASLCPAPVRSGRPAFSHPTDMRKPEIHQGVARFLAARSCAS